MSSAGRPPQSASARAVRGNPGKRGRPAKPGAPIAPPPQAPSPRRGLLPAVAREFARLRELLADRGVVLDPADAPALELLAGALTEYHAMRAFVDEHGATYETTTESGSVMHREYPQVRLSNDAWRRASAALKTFGLTPADRARVEASPKDSGPVDPGEAFMRSLGV